LIVGDVVWVETKKAILIERPIGFYLTLICMLVIPFVDHKIKKNETPLLLNSKNGNNTNA